MPNLAIKAVRLSIPYLIALLLLFGAYTDSYLLFHTTVEMLTTLVAVSLFMMVWNARKIVNNNFLIFLSIIYFFVGVINFFHFLAYKGMPFFHPFGSTLSSQLWISERFLLALSLPIALATINHKLDEIITFFSYTMVTIVILASIFVWKIFPTTYIDGRGLTPFKISAEYVICTLFVVSVGLFRYYRRKFDRKTHRFLIISCLVNVVVELLFTLYAGLFDFVTVVAHVAILFSYLLVYKAIIEIGMTKPFSLLFFELQALIERKDELLHIASHELKNPLTNIQLYSELLHNQLIRTKPSHKTSPMMRKIQFQIGKVNRLISDLNDMSKIETGNFSLQKTMVDMKKYLTDIIKDIHALNPDYAITLTIPDVPLIWCDQDRVGQVIINLITNAIKFSPHNSNISVNVLCDKQKVIIEIQDQGVGIPKNKLRYVFDKYFRLEKQEPSIPGLGLGLYISKQIIDQHHGKIWVKSQIGKGSTFSFSLPVLPENIR